MPAYNPSVRNSKIVEKVQGGTINSWDATQDGYNQALVENIPVKQYTGLLLNISTAFAGIVATSTGDVSLGMSYGQQLLAADRMPLKNVTGSLNWNLSPRPDDQQANFFWSNGESNIDAMSPKFISSPFSHYLLLDAPTNNTAKLPYIPNLIDLYFRQTTENANVSFTWTLFGIYGAS